jgi:hypothetical protein
MKFTSVELNDILTGYSHVFTRICAVPLIFSSEIRLMLIFLSRKRRCVDLLRLNLLPLSY